MDETNELLAPAGSFDSLMAAIAAGADAVYLGGKEFGARKFAYNFTDAELLEALAMAHEHSVKVYVALNTLITPERFQDVLKFLGFLERIGVDGVIMQDMGVAYMAKKLFPKLKLHASVQMTIHNSFSLEWARKSGFSRVVVAREIEYENLKQMVQKFKGIEVFIHGALCYSYSGQCLISGLLNERAANLGMCAQVCRKAFQLERDNIALETPGPYLLSMRDLNTSPQIRRVLELGVKSLKIEGRMKNPDYVYAVVSVYRELIDNYRKGKKSEISGKSIAVMELAYNRTFTKGYMMGDTSGRIISLKRPNRLGLRIGRVLESRAGKTTFESRSMVGPGDIIEFIEPDTLKTLETLLVKGIQKKKNIFQVKTEQSLPYGTMVNKIRDIKAKQKLKKALETRRIRRKSLDVEFHVKIKEGEPIVLEVISRGKKLSIKSKNPVLKARKNPVQEMEIVRWLEKTGLHFINVKRVNVELKGRPFLLPGEFKALRRRLLECLVLQKKQCKQEEGKTIEYEDYPGEEIIPENNPRVGIIVENAEKVRELSGKGWDILYYDCLYGLSEKVISRKLQEILEVNELCRRENKEFVLKLPRITHDSFFGYFGKLLAELKERGIDKYQISNPGQALFIKRAFKDAHIFADTSFNVTNHFTVLYLESFVERISLSLELEREQIKELVKIRFALGKDSLKPFSKGSGVLEVLIWGYPEAMITRNCILNTSLEGTRGGSCSKPCIEGEYSIIDKKGRNYRVIPDKDCRNHILNFEERDWISHTKELLSSGISLLTLDGRYAGIEYVRNQLKRLENALENL
ncbi:putative protease YhbU precursor [archaeon BMS3Bbin15]|nr:putative protease YhbU precursor [archaeon BMS3Bbin15]